MKETLTKMVYNDIISKIKSGEYKPGEKIPTEYELTKIYNTSRITITKAMAELAKINIIYRIKKSGTFINGKINLGGKQLLIPIIIPFEQNVNQLVSGIESVSILNNVFTPIYISRNNIIKERKILLDILNSSPDGIIIYPCYSLENLDLFIEINKKGIPIVCIDRNIQGLSTPLVTTNNYEKMVEIITKLRELNFKKIGYFSISNYMSQTETERFEGFCYGIIKNQLKFNKEYIFNTENLHLKENYLTEKRQASTFSKVVEKNVNLLLSMKEKPEIIVCVNDISMSCLYNQFVKLNIKNPPFLTGFDCANPDILNEVKLLSVKQDFFNMGVRSIKIALNIIKDNIYSTTERINGELICNIKNKPN